MWYLELLAVFSSRQASECNIISDLLLNYGATEKPTVTSEHLSYTTRQRTRFVNLKLAV